MLVYAIPAVAAAVMLALVASMGLPAQVEATAVADNELARYKIFVSTADQFFKTAAAPGVLTAYTWDTIKAAAPPGYESFAMRTDWKVVRGPDGTWAACTQLEPLTVAALNSIYAPVVATTGGLASQRLLPSDLSSGGAGALGLNANNAVIAIGKPTDAVAAANLCDGA